MGSSALSESETGLESATISLLRQLNRNSSQWSVVSGSTGQLENEATGRDCAGCAASMTMEGKLQNEATGRDCAG
jgi:hypothetical protein